MGIKDKKVRQPDKSASSIYIKHCITLHIKVHERSKQTIYPRQSLKNIQYLLLCDRLICGLWVGFRCRSKNGVNVDINERKQLRMEWSGGFTELPIDPVLEKTCHYLFSFKAESNLV